MKTLTEKIKQDCMNAGVDLVGITPVERFTEAPAGFHPADVLPSCMSVIVLCGAFSADS